MQIEIGLEGLVFYGYHGVMNEEGALGNRFEVNVWLSAEVGSSAFDDDIHQTVDYYKIYALISQVMHERKKLLESLAQLIASAILSQFEQVAEVKVQVSKYNPPLKGLCERAYVTFTQKRG
jgi:dihydroneopterin aldolase